MNRSQAHTVLDALLDVIQEQAPSPYYTQNDSPLGAKRHARLVRDGKLKGIKPDGSRLVYVKREDVHSWIERYPVKGVRREVVLPKKKKTPERAVEDLLG